MKSKLLIAALILSGVSIVNAAPQFQAGNILEGQKWSFSEKTGGASYYADGKSGRIEFQCDLEGQGRDIGALLRPGKNFQNKFNKSFTSLKRGMNGPFTWTLTNEGENVGNIKIFAGSGSNLTIQCKGEKVS